MILSAVVMAGHHAQRMLHFSITTAILFVSMLTPLDLLFLNWTNKFALNYQYKKYPIYIYKHTLIYIYIYIYKIKKLYI